MSLTWVIYMIIEHAHLAIHVMYWERSHFLLATSLLLAVTFSSQSIPAQCDGIDNLFWDVSIHVTFESIAISSYCVRGLFVPVINAFSCFVIHWLKRVLPTSYSDYCWLHMAVLIRSYWVLFYLPPYYYPRMHVASCIMHPTIFFLLWSGYY